MGVKERREREKQELRDRILDAARAIFAAEGYDAVSMRRIAEQIEYSPAAIYSYFPDKESLFREICRNDFLSLLEQFKQASEIRDPIERLWLTGQAYIEFGVSHPSHYRMMFMRNAPHIPPDTEDLRRMGDPNQDGYAFTRATIEEGMAAGAFRPEFDDAELVMQTVWAVVHGVTSIEITFRNDPWLDMRPLKDRRDHAMRTLFRGILRDPARADRLGGKS